MSFEHITAAAEGVRPARIALTPALSSRENEERLLPDCSDDDRRDLATRRGSLAVLTCTPQRSDTVEARSPHHNAADVPPLPGGEGWGEGDSPALFRLQSPPQDLPILPFAEAGAPLHFVPTPPAARLIEQLATGEAHIWRARAEALREPLDAECLSAEELQRADRLRLPGQRAAFVFAHSLQRHVLSQYLHLAPGQLVFGFEGEGKPALRHGVQFNLTHSGSAALLAVSLHGAVGIDLEDGERRVDLESLALACLSDSERRQWDRVPAHQRQACLLQWWTRKEAVLKGQGCGLTRDPRELAVTRAHEPFPAQAGSLDDQGRHWRITDLPLGPRWRAAVAIGGPACALKGFCLGW